MQQIQTDPSHLINATGMIPIKVQDLLTLINEESNCVEHFSYPQTVQPSNIRLHDSETDGVLEQRICNPPISPETTDHTQTEYHLNNSDPSLGLEWAFEEHSNLLENILKADDVFYWWNTMQTCLEGSDDAPNDSNIGINNSD